MAFTLPDLPYPSNALEPHIDARTMEIHHGKHHNGYVTKLNDAVAGTEWASKPVEDLCANLGRIPENIRTAVRNNGGGHFNHSLFWSVMGPNGGGDAERRRSATRSTSAFGSVRRVQGGVRQGAAATRFGSGWAWLGVKAGRRPSCVCSTAEPGQSR